jgi:glycosyltransferase involved in cell wall biosynthesis
MMRRIAYCSPINPVPSGISDYSEDLLPYLAQYADITLYHDSGVTPSNPQLTTHLNVRPITSLLADQQRQPYDAIIYHMGNSTAHCQIWDVAQQLPGVIVLHDLVVHHFMLQYYATHRNDIGAYQQLVAQHYGAAGERVATRMLRGVFDDAVFEMPLCQPILAHATALISHSQYVVDAVQPLAPNLTTAVVPMGVPLLPDSDVAHLRAQLNLGDDAFIMASFGHVNPYKRTDQVLRALRTLRRAGINAHYVIVGSISPKVALDTLVRRTGTSGAVHVTGYVSANEFNAYVALADVCINLRHPTAGETSASLLRLLAAGKPTFVTASGSFNEIPSTAAIHIPLDKSESEFLETALFLCQQRPDFRATLAANARAYVEQHHTLAQSAAAYMQFLAHQHGWEAPSIQRPLPWDNAATQITLPATLQPRRIVSAPPLTIVGTTADDTIVRGAQAHIDQAAQTLFIKK